MAALLTGILATLAIPLVLRSGLAQASELSRFDGCPAVRSYLQGLEKGAPAPPLTAGAASPVAGSGADTATSDGGGGAGDTGATNVQVAGVDELDVADTDGKLIVVAGDANFTGKTFFDRVLPGDQGHPTGVVRLVDPATKGVLDTETIAGGDQQLTWDAADGVVWVTSQDFTTEGDGGPLTRITRLRVDGTSLTADGTSTVRGSLVGARRVGPALHVVATDGGGPFPAYAGGSAGVGVGATEPYVANGGIAEDVSGQMPTPTSDLPTPLPDTRLPFDGGDVTVACDQVWRPAGPSQPSAVLVASFDATTEAAGGKLAPAGATEVAGGGSLLYGTAKALYVATTLWAPPEADGSATTSTSTSTSTSTGTGSTAPSTSIHRFALDDLRWTGSGRVPGIPLNQFAFDENGGVLRVATTVEESRVFAVPENAMPVDGSSAPVRTIAPQTPKVDNLIVTLDTDGDLDERGRLSGLGKPGERIQGVRFSGDVAYVVTFRQTDPLYVVDLSDPNGPRTAGELHLPGFSSYLHPVGDGLMVGIGRAGTEEGRLQGAQAELFDVSDPRSPRLVDQEALGDDSAAANDYLAFAELGGGRFAVPSVDWPNSRGVTIKPFPGPDPAPPVPVPTPAPAPFPVPIEPPIAQAAPVVTVVQIQADKLGLGRTAVFTLDPPDTSGSYRLASLPLRTMTVGDGVAVVAGSYGVALFDADGTSAGWILF